MRSLLPFRPPRVHVTRELRWVLQAAFAQPEERSDFQAERILKLARSLDLAARIAGRLSQDELMRALGSEAARALIQQRLAVRAGNRVLLNALQRVAACAATLDVPLVLLKFAALAELRAIGEGDRDARDVDLLVASTDAHRLWSELLRSGSFQALGEFEDGSSLPGLQGAERELVELNRHVKGLRMPGANSDLVTLEELQRHALLHPGKAANCWTPAPALLAAHATVHGLVQHGNVVGYPGMRLLSDLADLCELSAIEASAAQRFVGPLISPTLMPSALAVSSALRAGGSLDQLSGDSEASLIFRHLVAASCDAEYQRSLPFQRVLQLRAERRLLRVVFDRVRRPATETQRSDPTSGASIARVLRIGRDGLSSSWHWFRLPKRGAREI